MENIKLLLDQKKEAQRLLDEQKKFCDSMPADVLPAGRIKADLDYRRAFKASARADSAYQDALDQYIASQEKLTG